MNHQERIVEAAVDLFEEDPKSVTIEAICRRADIDEATFAEHFSDVGAAFEAWYVSAVDRTAGLLHALPDYELQPLEERLGALCFTLLDVLEPRMKFVERTFGERAAGFATPFQNRLRQELVKALQASDVPAVNRLVVDTAASRFVLAETIVQLVNRWIADDSPDRGRTTALTDKVLGFIADILTDPVPQRAFDLTRYLVEAGYIPLKRIPIIGDWFKKDRAEA